MTRPDDWAVLRCAGASTLRLADSLAEAGFEVWTPREEVQRVVRGKVEWVKAPLIPTFVFAASHHLAELLQLARSPALSYLQWDSEKQRMVAKGHPFFRLFQPSGEFCLIPDHELTPLRTIEGRRARKPRGTARQFEPGDKVRLTQGAYAGLHGLVSSARGSTVSVIFSDTRFEAKIHANLLIPELDDHGSVHVHTRLPERRFRNAA